MGLRAPTPLDVGHALERFGCGKPALNDWLHRPARQAQSSGSARTFIVADDDHVVGYYSLTYLHSNRRNAERGHSRC